MAALSGSSRPGSTTTRSGSSSLHSSFPGSTSPQVCNRKSQSAPEPTAKTATLRSEQLLWLSWEKSFQCEKGRLRAISRAKTHVTPKDLDPQIVFEAEDTRLELQSSGQLTNRFRTRPARSPLPNRRSCPGTFILPRPLNLRLSLFRNLVRASRRRATLAVAALRATRHVSLAAHRRRHRGVGLRQRRNPHHAQHQPQQPRTPPMRQHHHRLSLPSPPIRQSDGRHGLGAPPPGSRTMFSPASRRTDRTTCGVITMASSAMSTFEFLFVVS
jgi:hypothetical protein